MELHSINREQRSYVMPSGNGFSCYGFDVVHRKLHALAAVLGIPVKSKYKGTKKQFFEYAKVIEIARKSGRRFDVELYKPFIGLEGKRIEVTQKDGQTRRFWLGKSTGFIPIHLEVPTRRSMGGIPVFDHDIKSFRIVG